MKNILFAILFLFFSSANAFEPKHLYWGYFGCPSTGAPSVISNIVNGVPQCTTIPPQYMCQNGFMAIPVNPFIPSSAQWFGLNITTPVYIVGAQANVWDDVASHLSQLSVQRESDWAFVFNLNVVDKRGTLRTTFDGTYIKLEPTDRLVLESSCPHGTNRVIGITLIYTLTPPN